MWGIPSFMSWPLGLPSLPSISLPANIQRRFLSYVLKRTLGRFVKAGGLDVERIQAQISEGWVEIEGLEVDTEAVNELVPSDVPLTISSGSLGKVTAWVPFPNLWSDPLALTLDTLILEFDLVSSPLTTERRSAGDSPRRSFGAIPPFSPVQDLAASVTSAADEFLHGELDAYEEAQLDRSIRDSLLLSAGTPTGGGNDVPGAFPFPQQEEGGLASAPSSTVLAGLIERVLSRLQFKVRTVRVRIRSNDEAHGSIFELRIDEIRYADETDPESAGSQSTTRVVRVCGVSVYMLPSTSASSAGPTPPSGQAGMSRRSSTTSTASSSSTAAASSGDDSSDPSADMAMSMAVADLRESTASVVSGASVYESAYGEVFQDAGEEPQFSAVPTLSALDHDTLSGSSSGSGSRSATPTRASSPDPISETLLLSFGNDDIVLQLRTTAAAQTASAISISVSIGTIAILLAPQHIACILAACNTASLAGRGAGTSESPPTAATAPGSERTPLDARLTLKAIHVVVIYDLAISATDHIAAVDAFWQKPGTAGFPNGHVRLRIEGVDGKYGGSKPKLSASIRDASLLEHIAPHSSASTDAPDPNPPGGDFPILIFDPNLPQQYSQDIVTSGASALFPSFEMVDWRNAAAQRRGGPTDKAWRVRPKQKGALKTGKPPAIPVAKPVMDWSQGAGGNQASVSLQPVHIFLDLSLVERLLPMLRLVSPVYKGPAANDSPYIASKVAGASKSTSSARHSSQAHLGAVDPQIASVSTVKGKAEDMVRLAVQCPLIRLDIRCPAPPSRRGTWGESVHLRSGIVTLDILGLSARLHAPTSPSIEANRKTATFQRENSEAVGAVGFEKMVLYFCRATEEQSTAFLVIGPLDKDARDESDILPLVPQVSITKVSVNRESPPLQVVSCRIPSVRAKIRQSTVEGMQFFADDMARWLDGAFGDASAPKPKDDLKMIGSRFFGSKASSSASSSALDDDEEEEEASSATRFSIMVSETDIALHVPRKLDNPAGPERILSLRASDLDAKVESNVKGQRETAFSLAVMDIEFSDRTDPARISRILGRTLALSPVHIHRPLASLRFSSSVDQETGNKETGVKLVCSGWTFFVNKDLAWIGDLARFAKTPEGVFEDMTPSEVTRIHVELYDCSIHVSAPTVPGGVVVVLGEIEVRTDIVSDADEQVVTLGMARSCLFAADRLDAVSTLPTGYQQSPEAWRKAGWAQMAELVTLDVHILRDLTGKGEIAVDVLAAHVRLMGCADSLATLGLLAGDMGNLAPRSSQAPTPGAGRQPVSLERSINVFASLDEEAFRRMPDVTSGADMIDDDLPTNLDYLDTATKQPTSETGVDKATGETLRSWQTEDEESDGIEGGLGGGTIRILHWEPFVLEHEDYWEDVLAQRADPAIGPQQGRLHIRLHDCSLGIFLHEGYDWQRTRKTIEDEMRAVRKRLERIKQLLASGQEADDSIERPSSLLYNSIYIGLDQSRGDLDAAALLAAIDDELEDLDEAGDTASQSSWQSLPTVRGRHAPPPPAQSGKVRLRGKRLTRSKKAQVEIALQGVRGDIDLYGPDNETASSIEVHVKSFEILDHIKTSTWKKFLTELKADSRGNIRETDADMVRISMSTIRPSLPSLAEEVRLKLKVLPLRLHVDQDAMDFLKRLGAFKPAKEDGPAIQGDSMGAQPAKKPSTPSPFFQHVEIHPVQLKLDYKPKRVDFAALREGKTIELMNFFHFEGAEMTLRHITLSGVAGWDRLSTLLQDTWTPDVKANQLADVISGVSPIRSVVNVGSGVADLILLPIEQYRKDGRIAKGMQRGANSFVRSTALEMMKLGAKLATGTQVVLEKAESVLGGRMPDQLIGEVESDAQAGQHSSPHLYSPGLGEGFEADSSEEEDARASRKHGDALSRYANQPGNAKEGVQAAYHSLSKNINSAAQTILAVPMEVYERSGDDGPLRAVVRAVPIAVLKPMIGATEAVSKTLLGVRNSIDPEARRQLNDKYK